MNYINQYKLELIPNLSLDHLYEQKELFERGKCTIILGMINKRISELEIEKDIKESNLNLFM